MIKSYVHRNYQYFMIYNKALFLKTAPDIIKLQRDFHLMAVANGKQQNNDGAFGFDVAITRSLNNKKPISLDMSEDFEKVKNVTSNSKTRKRRIINDEDDSTLLTENLEEIEPKKMDFDKTRKHISAMSEHFNKLENVGELRRNRRMTYVNNDPGLTEISKENNDPVRIRQVLADGLDFKKHQKPKTNRTKVPNLEVFLENPATYHFFENYNEIIERKPFDFDERSDRFDTNNLNFVLMNASVSKLTDLVISLTKCPPEDERKRLQIIKLLDEASIKQLESFEPKNPEKFIELCLAWFEFNQSQMELKQWGRIEGVSFPMSFLELALQTPKHFTSWQILLFVYICGFYGNGNIPGSLECPKKGYLKSYFLPSRLEKKFIKEWPTWNFKEKGIFCWVLFECRILFEYYENEELRNSILNSFKNISTEEVILAEPFVFSFSKLFSRDALRGSNQYGRFNQAEINQIISKFEPNFENLDNFTKIRLLTFLRTNGTVGKKTQMFLKNYMNMDFEGLRLKDLTVLVNALYPLNFHLYQDISNYLKKILKTAQMMKQDQLEFGQKWIYLLLACAKMGYIEEDIIDDLFRQVNNFQAFHEFENMDDYSKLDVALQFLFDFGRMSVEKTSLERLSKNLMIEGNLPLHTSAISYMAVLDFFIEMDFPEYKGNRMDPKIRSEFIKVQVSDIMSKMSKNNIQKPRGIREFRGSSYNQRFKINNDIYKEGFLKNFDSKKLYLGPTLPHYFDTRDIVLCVSNKKKREAMNIPPEFRKELELSQEIIKPPIFPGFSWYCFIVAKPPNLLKPQHLAGDWTTRVRHLEKLGYRVCLFETHMQDGRFNVSIKALLESGEVKKVLKDNEYHIPKIPGMPIIK